MACADVQIYEDDPPLARACPSMEDLWRKNELTDVEIELSKCQSMSAHRFVLAARVPHIRRLLSQNAGEGGALLQWRTVPKSILEPLMEYFYTGKLKISEITAKGILMLAKMLELETIEQWAVDFITGRINVGNIEDRLRFARRVQNKALTHACLSFMRSAYEETVATEVFLELPAEALLSLLRDDNLKVSSEEAVFQSLVRWVKPDCAYDKTRLQVLPELLREIRWAETSENFRQEAAKEAIMTEYPSCMDFLRQVNLFIDRPDRKSCPYNLTPRNSQIVVYGQAVNGDGQWVCHTYDPKTGLGRVLGRVKRRSHAALVCLRGGRILLVGGRIGENKLENATTRVDELDVHSGQWKVLAPMKIRRGEGHTATVVSTSGQQNQMVVVCGGRDESQRDLASCEMYDPRENRWQYLPDMRRKRCGAAAAVLPDGRLFLIGGLGDAADSVEFCRPTEGRTIWTSLFPGGFWRDLSVGAGRRFDNSAAAAFRGDLFVVGGFPASRARDVEVFHPGDLDNDQWATGQWTCGQRMNRPRAVSCSLLVHRDRLFALGSGYPSAQNTVEEFVPRNGAKADSSPDDFCAWQWEERPSPANIRDIWGAGILRF
nr:unnamed protein product [Spirometra erinaceieuropaei]